MEKYSKGDIQNKLSPLLSVILCKQHDELNVYLASLKIISEPPPQYPVLSINGNIFSGANNKFTVVEGRSYNLTCHVNGGFPASTNVSIKCASLPVFHNSFVFTRNMMSDKCTCIGDHISGCYDKTTSFTLQVLCEFIYYLCVTLNAMNR